MDERQILAALVAADEASCRRQTFTLSPVAATTDWAFAGVVWPDGVAVPSANDIDDLADRGWVRINSQSGHQRIFAVTSEGRRIDRLRAEAAARSVYVPVDLTWPMARSILRLMFEAYVQQGAPTRGVAAEGLVEHLEDPASAAAALRELVRAGYLEPVHAGQGDIPVLVRPTTKALQLEAGWPATGAEDVVGELVEMLDDEIDRTDDDERRSKLRQIRDGIAFVAKDLLLKWAETKVGGINL
jgi:hypothetical protein